ncbi:Phosphatidate cytidylyltransferase, mitochondrial [Aphelenchoides bicaudatus]|nr:Phosphatidate cytidylyltransferase, mitochondrial [Aphelenchoides bicaudatus]
MGSEEEDKDQEERPVLKRQPEKWGNPLRDLIDGLPLEYVEYVFAYGSGVIQQQNEPMSDKMVDFIVVTRDTPGFHEANRQQNPRHYSAIRFLGTNKLVQLQRYFGARLFFNTRVKTPYGRMIKYGIIDTKDLQEDLLEWRYLYASGRLHKPVVDVLGPSNAIRLNIEENRRSALQVALLQLPETFTLTDLIYKITRISYDGDFRLTIGEDKNKIKKVAMGAFDEFSAIYTPMLTADTRVFRSESGDRFEHDTSTPAIYHRLNLLPSNVLERMAGLYWYRDPRHRDIEEMVFRMSHRHDVTDQMTDVIRKIVRNNSLSQTAKNAITAGFTRSIAYSWTKLAKMFRSMR